MANIFISHVEQEKGLALAVERFLYDVFARDRSVSIFLSSNTFTLVGGEKFEERIRREIAGCKVFLMMCSKVSFRRHWLHVEAGAAWVADKPIVPICYGNLLKGTLPRPYSSFHAVALDHAYDLVVAVARALGLLVPPPGPDRMTLGVELLRSGKALETVPVYGELYAVLGRVLESQAKGRKRRLHLMKT
jgi:TIR domain